MQRPVVEEITVKTALNKVRAENMPFAWSVNPYRGCAHGCSFCYARAFHGFIGLAAGDEFQRRILVKTNAAEALEAQLAKISRKFKNPDEVGRYVGMVAIGTATDPYQPAEGKAQITRRCLEVLARYRVPVAITTRSPLVLRDLDLLKEMNTVAVNISLHTLNRDVVRRFEPAAPPPLKRLETLQRLSENGIRAGVFIAPILPYITDDLNDLEALMDTARAHRASFAMTSLLRLGTEVKPWFFRVLNEYDPRLVIPYAKLYTSTYADRSYSEPLMRRIRQLTERFGLADRHPEAEFQASSAKPNGCGDAEPVQLSFSF